MPAALESVYGFVQSISQPFCVKSHHVMLIKLTERANCFCAPCSHVLVRWPKNDESADCTQHRVLFLDQFALGACVNVCHVQRSKIYANQDREHFVWLYVPTVSEVCRSSSPLKTPHPFTCPAWPIGLVRSLNCQILALAPHGFAMQVTIPREEKIFLCISVRPVHHTGFDGESHFTCSNAWVCRVPPEWFQTSDPIYSGFILCGIYTNFSWLPTRESPVVKQLHLASRFPIDINSFLLYHWNNLLCSDQLKFQSSSVDDYLNRFLNGTQSSPPIQFAHDFLMFPISCQCLASPFVTVKDLARALSLQPVLSSRTSNRLHFEGSSRALSTECSIYRLSETQRNPASVRWLCNEHHSNYVGQPSMSGSCVTRMLYPHLSKDHGICLVGRLSFNYDLGCYGLAEMNPISESGAEIDLTFVPVFFDRLSLTKHNLPSNGMMVALNQWCFLSDKMTTSSGHSVTSYIFAEHLVPLECNLSSDLSETFHLIELDCDCAAQLRLLSLGTPRRQCSSTFGYEILTEDGSHVVNRLLLVGPIAMRCYQILQAGCVYRFRWKQSSKCANDNENFQRPLIEDPELIESITVCHHLFPFSDVTAILGRFCRDFHSLSPPVSFDASVLYKFEHEQGLVLWLTDVHFVSRFSDDTDLIELPLAKLLILLHPVSSTWFGASCIPVGKRFVVRFHHVHPARIFLANTEYPLLITSSLSRVELLRLGSFVCDKSLYLKTTCQKCSSLVRTDQKQAQWLIQNLRTDALPTGFSLIRGHIIKCLEFGCWKIPDCKTEHPRFAVYMRLIIDDGSASALVQLGTPKPSASLTEMSYHPVTPCEQLAAQTLRCAQTLFGFHRTLWTRFLSTLNNLVANPPGAFSLSLTEFASASHPPRSSFETALHSYFNSPAFLRPHEFVVRRESCRNRLGPWRLRETRLSHEHDPSQSRELSLVCPPLNVYTLFDIRNFVIR